MPKQYIKKEQSISRDMDSLSFTILFPNKNVIIINNNNNNMASNSNNATKTPEIFSRLRAKLDKKLSKSTNKIEKPPTRLKELKEKRRNMKSLPLSLDKILKFPHMPPPPPPTGNLNPNKVSSSTFATDQRMIQNVTKGQYQHSNSSSPSLSKKTPHEISSLSLNDSTSLVNSSKLHNTSSNMIVHKLFTPNIINIHTSPEDVKLFTESRAVQRAAYEQQNKEMLERKQKILATVNHELQIKKREELKLFRKTLEVKARPMPVYPWQLNQSKLPCLAAAAPAAAVTLNTTKSSIIIPK